MLMLNIKGKFTFEISLFLSGHGHLVYTAEMLVQVQICERLYLIR